MVQMIFAGSLRKRIAPDASRNVESIRKNTDDRSAFEKMLADELNSLPPLTA